MITNRSNHFNPEIPVGTRIYCKINKKTYEKKVSDGVLSRWISETGASILSSDEHIYNPKSFKFINNERS